MHNRLPILGRRRAAMDDVRAVRDNRIQTWCRVARSLADVRSPTSCLDCCVFTGSLSCPSRSQQTSFHADEITYHSLIACCDACPAETSVRNFLHVEDCRRLNKVLSVCKPQHYWLFIVKAVVTTTIRLQFDRATTMQRPTLRLYTYLLGRLHCDLNRLNK